MDYLLKSMLCLLALLLIHRLLLQREVLHRFNRFFLLAAVIGSFLIPFVTIEVPMEKVEPVAFEAVDLSENEALEYQSFSAVEEAEISESVVLDKSENATVSPAPFPWEKSFWIAYFAISAIFLFRFLRNLGRLLRQIRTNPHMAYHGEILVLHPDSHSPFSFLKYIFVSRRSFEQEGISDAVFAHERCHVRERHSWDVLLVEALLVPFWFHPALYLARHAIQLNHEFIADQAALGATSVKDYQHQLLSILLDRPSQSMVSSLNFSLTKKRMQMMNKKSGSPLKWLKLLALIPLIGTLGYFFGEKVAVQPEEVLMDSPSETLETPVEEVEIEIRLLTDMEVEVDGKVIYVEQLAQLLEKTKKENALVRFSSNPRLKMGVAADIQEMLREQELRKLVYDEWPAYVPSPNWEEERAIYYEKVNIIVEDENMEYTRKTYQQLSEEEKKFLIGPMNEPSKKTPHSLIFEVWKNEAKYTLWLDQKVISNEQLSKLQPSDIVMFWTSRVTESAKSASFPQPFQVHLYTDEYYENELMPNLFRKNPLTNQDTITLTSRFVTWERDISKYPDPNTAYLQKNARYEKLRTSGTIYPQKSTEEKALLDSLYMELSNEYSQSSDKRKKSLKQPISPDSDSPRNGNSPQNSSEKIAVQNTRPLGGKELVYEFVSSNGERSVELQEYLALYGKYQTITYENRLFEQPVIWGVLHQQKMFKELEARYNGLSFDDRRRVKRAAFPYVKMEKDGRRFL